MEKERYFAADRVMASNCEREIVVDNGMWSTQPSPLNANIKRIVA